MNRAEQVSSMKLLASRYRQNTLSCYAYAHSRYQALTNRSRHTCWDCRAHATPSIHTGGQSWRLDLVDQTNLDRGYRPNQTPSRIAIRHLGVSVWIRGLAVRLCRLDSWMRTALISIFQNCSQRSQ